MPEEKTENPPVRTPAGFTPHTGGLASEYAREMGWGLNEPERAKEPEEKQDADGGTDYDSGAADFGNTAKDTSEGKVPVLSEAKPPVKSEVKPPILVVQSFQKATRKTEQKSKVEQNPKKRIA
jgi:hypothetical protein